jgi:hypothetical protein
MRASTTVQESKVTLCAMCHNPIAGSADMTDIGLMHSDPYTYDECSCYDAYLGGSTPDRQ